MFRRVRVGLALFVAIALQWVLQAGIAFGSVPPTADHPWRALHVISYTNDSALKRLAEQLPQLSKLGINCLILEVNYGFEYQSHPELRQGDRQITKDGARSFLAKCRDNGIELVPQFQCLGHQSWSKNTARSSRSTQSSI